MQNPIIILTGEEKFLLDRELHAIRKSVVDPAMASFNHDRFTAGDTKLGPILDMCRELPMMCERRLVEIHSAENITKDEMELLEKYFAAPIDSTVLLILASKIDKRLKAWAVANKSGWIKEFKPLYDNQIPAWLLKEAHSRSLSLSEDAAVSIADSIGTSLGALIGALEQLETFVHPVKKITLKDVDQVVGDGLTRTVFDFVGSLGSRQHGEATRLLSQLLTKGEEPVKIFFLIVRQFRLLLLARECIDAKTPEREMAGVLGVSPFFVKDYVGQARKLTAATLRKVYSQMILTARSQRRSGLGQSQLLYSFVSEVCH